MTSSNHDRNAASQAADSSDKDVPGPRAAGPTRRRRGLLYVLVIAVLACASFSVAYVAAQRLTAVPEQGALAELSLADPADTDPNPSASETTSVLSSQHLPPLDPLVPESSEQLLDEARRVAGDLVVRFAQNPDAYETVARFHRRMGNTSEAETAWQTSLQLNPQYAHAMEGLASIAFRRGDYPRAVSLLRQALLIRPDAPEVQTELAKTLLAQGKPQDAVELLERTVGSNSSFTEAFLQLGAALLQLKEYERAKEAYEKAAALDPDHGPAWFGLATAAARLGQTEEAQRYQARLQETRSERESTLREERQSYEDFQALSEDVARSYSEMGHVYLAEGDAVAAEYLWRRAAYLHDENIEARQALAWLYGTKGQLLKTIRMMFQLAEIDPDNMSYPLESARLFLELGQPQDAEWVLKRRAEPKAGRDMIHAALAELYLHALHNPPQALEHAQQAVELAPTAENLVLLSSAREAVGDQAGAIEAMKQAVQKDPENFRYRQIYELMKESGDQSRPSEPQK